LALSGWVQGTLANAETTPKCADADTAQEEKLSEYTIDCANIAINMLNKAENDVATIEAAKIVIEAYSLFSEADDKEVPEEAKAKFEEAKAIAEKNLIDVIEKNDDNSCKSAMETLHEISPKIRSRLKKAEKKVPSFCGKERGTDNPTCHLKGNC
jgi:translation elongation factor EF-G